MPDIFINYRTGDGDKTAILLERELNHRFGEGRAFRAAEAIKPGEVFPSSLLRGVQQSSVLLSVIGPTWIGSPRLHDESDWVRKEILEAFACGIRVIPVLDGRKTRRLDPTGLPPELVRLADIQSLPLDPQKIGSDLNALGNRLVELIPELEKADRAHPTTGAPKITRNVAGEVYPPIIREDNVTGDRNTLVRESYGPMTFTQGGIHNDSSRHVSMGSAGSYVEGDVHGGINHTSGGSHAPRDSDSR